MSNYRYKSTLYEHSFSLVKERGRRVVNKPLTLPVFLGVFAALELGYESWPKHEQNINTWKKVGEENDNNIEMENNF